MMSKKRKTFTIAGLLGIAAASLASAQGFSPFDPFIDPIIDPVAAPAPKIQVAIVLDTSGSMSGLIEQTKRQLWKIVNGLSGYERAGQKPVLEIALLQYGSAGIPTTLGAMRTLKPLSTQLDQVSKELFPLSANGSEEYVPMAISKAILEFQWSANPNDVKAIFTAGNETVHQGPLTAESLAPLAKLVGIEVSTVFAGLKEDAVFDEWQQLASSLGGTSGNIDQSIQVPSIPTPFDTELAELNKQLNATIIFFGSGGFSSWQSYLETDKLYGGSGGAFYDLVNAKTSGFYDISGWDLVTAVTAGTVSLGGLDKKTLPQELQGMTDDELLAHIEKLSEERKALEAAIADLAAKREEYLKPLIEAAIGDKEALLQQTLIKALESQLERKGFMKP